MRAFARVRRVVAPLWVVCLGVGRATRVRRPDFAIATLIIAATVAGGARAAPGDASISATVYGAPLVVTTSSRFAGAISSLTWSGKQFIDSADHGRELQSAVSYEGLGECLNPTEAGNHVDTTTSTSVLGAINTSGNILRTTIQMAYWLKASEPYKDANGDDIPCSPASMVNQAQNTTDLSNDLLSKQVTIGFGGVPNALEYQVEFHVAQNHQVAQFETLTAYMPLEFSWFLSYEPTKGSLRELPDNPPGEQPLPVIFSTPDRAYAMGAFSPDLPDGVSGYGRARVPNVVLKWNMVHRRNPAPAGGYSFNRNYVIVGTLDQVIIGMSSVAQIFHGNTLGNLVGVKRFFSASHNEHFYTVNLFEGLDGGFTPEGNAFFVLGSNTGIGGTRPLYRCLWTAQNKHFISTASNCEGQMVEGTYGYAYTSQQPSTVALNRFFKAAIADHLETTDFNEGVAAGYTFESVLGYVPVM